MLEVVYDSDTHVIIRGEAVFAYAVQLYDNLSSLFGKDRSVIIDLSAITDIDLSAFQIFVALSRENGEGHVRVVKCPPQVKRRIEVAGLDKWIRVEGKNNG